MRWLPDAIMFGVPLALSVALSFAFRRRGLGTHALIWLAGLPVSYVVTVFLTLVISFQVFGVDLVD